MLSTILGLFGGKSIKYIVIAGVISALGFGIWTALNAYNSAIEKAAIIETQLKEANQEVEVANANTEEVARMFTEEQARTRKAQAISRSRKKRAAETSDILTHILNGAGDPAVIDYKRMLNAELERGQGYAFDDSTSTNPASATSIPDIGFPFACFDKRTAQRMITNATVMADYIEDVERIK